MSNKARRNLQQTKRKRMKLRRHEVIAKQLADQAKRVAWQMAHRPNREGWTH